MHSVNGGKLVLYETLTSLSEVVFRVISVELVSKRPFLLSKRP
jgi:hypothetical protein